MPRSPWRFWLSALTAAFTFDFLFWKTQPGINFLLWVIILLVVGFTLAFVEKKKPAWQSYVLAGLALLFAAFAFIRTQPFTGMISLMAVFGSLVLLTATFSTGNWPYYRLWDHLTAWAKLTIAAISRTLTVKWDRPAPVEPVDGKKNSRRLFAVLRGILLAIPVVAVLTLLLASADMVFAERMAGLLEIFDLTNLPEYIFRLIYILIMAYVLVGILLHALYPDKSEPRPDPQQPWMKAGLGFTEAGIVVLAVDILFLFFVFIQGVYLFGGKANIVAAGYTFSEYARRGFFELVAVAVISLLIYLGLNTITRRETVFQKRGFSALVVLLMGLVLVILASSYQRLLLYEEAYGFSQLRLHTHIFILWLGGLLIASILLVILRRPGHFALALMSAVLGFGLTIGLMNVDGYIVRQNVARALEGKELDSAYLSELSDDSVPAMFSLYNDPKQPAFIHDQLGGELTCRVLTLNSEKPDQWRGYHWGHSQAANLLTAQKDALTARYQDKTSTEPMVIVDGQTRSCIVYGWID